MFRENRYIPHDPKLAKQYFEQKYGDLDEEELGVSKTNRSNARQSKQGFMPMDGKFTREFARIRHEREKIKHNF